MYKEVIPPEIFLKLVCRLLIKKIDKIIATIEDSTQESNVTRQYLSIEIMAAIERLMVMIDYSSEGAEGISNVLNSVGSLITKGQLTNDIEHYNKAIAILTIS